ncbi:MAG: Fe-S protein assembly co-chaperone HscB [Planctomycetes bacterium]|nr:Fe-S protein assembly co-chaperone HscB [Planctomycetota bacterium]
MTSLQHPPTGTPLDSTDHFAILDLEPKAGLDLDRLERNYLTKSRDAHPDRNASGSGNEATLARQAALNEAYRVLRDPWLRFAYLVELRAPGTMDATKTLDPAFLMQAMELHEEAVEAAADESNETRLATLERDTRAVIEDAAARIAALLDDESEDTNADAARKAARRLHEVRYARRRLEVLTVQSRGGDS